MKKLSAKKLIIFSLFFLIIAFILIYKGVKIVEEPFKREYELFRSVKVGMNEHDVISLLGQPDKIYQSESAAENYYIEGYSHKKRTIINKVFIYIGTEPIAYIYFDNQNQVEDVFVGGS